MYKPSPPSDREKLLYIDSNKILLYVLGVLSLLILTTGMVLFVINDPLLYPYLFFVALLFFYLSASYSVGLMGEDFDLDRHHKILEKHAGYFPTVDIYLPCCGEDYDIIFNTHYHVSKLRYRPGLMNVYVLDDKGDDRIKFFAQHFGFRYIHRPNPGELKKAGNIRYAFKQTEGEYIVILDADFCPRPEFLYETLPYFKNNPNLAILQTPQYFTIAEGQTWAQKGAAYVQELFYRLIQVNRNTFGASVCVGTCAVYRRSALEPHGGTAAIAYSEDLHTGFQALEDGLDVEYIPVNLTGGVCPDTLSAFLNQQYRWCTGSFSLFLTKRFWTAKITPIQKLCFLTGMCYYIATGVGLIMIPIPSIVMTWFYPEAVFWYNTLFALPSFIYGMVAIAVWSKAPWGFYAVQIRQASYWAHLLAMYDKLKNQTVGWVATGDTNIKKSGGKISDRVKTVMAVWSIITFALVIAGALHNLPTKDWYHFAPTIFFSGLSFYIHYTLYKEL